MKTGKLKLFLAFISLTLCLISQNNDSINRFDEKHKKYGFWKVYLTDYLIETKDTSKAFYYCYDYYFNGRLIISTSSAQYYKKKAVKVVSDNDVPKIGHPQLLNGHFKFYYSYGLGLDETYTKGLPEKVLTMDSDPTGKTVVVESIDFSRNYNGQFGSFLYERFKINGVSTYRRWYAFDKKGRPVTYKVD